MRADIARGRSAVGSARRQSDRKGKPQGVFSAGTASVPGTALSPSGRVVRHTQRGALLHQPSGNAHGRVHGTIRDREGVPSHGPLQFLRERPETVASATRARCSSYPESSIFAEAPYSLDRERPDRVRAHLLALGSCRPASGVTYSRRTATAVS